MRRLLAVVLLCAVSLGGILLLPQSGSSASPDGCVGFGHRARRSGHTHRHGSRYRARAGRRTRRRCACRGSESDSVPPRVLPIATFREPAHGQRPQPADARSSLYVIHLGGLAGRPHCQRHPAIQAGLRTLHLPQHLAPTVRRWAAHHRCANVGLGMHFRPGLSGRRRHARRRSHAQPDVRGVSEHGRLRRILREAGLQRDVARHRIAGWSGSGLAAVLQRGEPSAGTDHEHARSGRERAAPAGSHCSPHDGGRTLGQLHDHRATGVRNQFDQRGEYDHEQLRSGHRYAGRRSRRLATALAADERPSRRLVPGVRHRHLQRLSNLYRRPIRSHLPGRHPASQHRRPAGHRGLAPCR